MTRLIVAKDAERDVARILAYLEQNANAVVAEEYSSALLATMLRLMRFPDIGAPRPDLGTDVRVVTLHPFLVIYEHGTGAPELILLRVLHGASNVTAEILMG